MFGEPIRGLRMAHRSKTLALPTPDAIPWGAVSSRRACVARR